MAENDLMAMMTIDCESVSNKIVHFLRKTVDDKGKDGILLGLSGGVDSATVVVLAKRAVGPSKTYALYLPDRDSEKRFAMHAKNIAEELDINFEVREITQSVQQQNVYKPLIMRIIKYFPILNKLIVSFSNNIIYPLFFKDNPFAVILRKELSIRNMLAKMVYNGIALAIENGFNARHIQRRKILEAYASEKNLLLIGAANRSESFVGWFVKDGVDDIPVETLLGLYKNQVRQLARFLEVPEDILSELPSPDMFKGVGDEEIIGFTYDIIDKVAYIIEHNLDPQLTYEDGIKLRDFKIIKRLNQLSAWKRENKHEYPLFD